MRSTVILSYIYCSHGSTLSGTNQQTPPERKSARALIVRETHTHTETDMGLPPQKTVVLYQTHYQNPMLKLRVHAYM